MSYQDPNNPESRFPKSSGQTLRIGLALMIVAIVAFGAAALVFRKPGLDTVGLGAAPAVSLIPSAPEGAPPRYLDQGAPFSFADLVQRVNPAVVTVTVEEEQKPQPPAALPGNIPPQFRDFFNRFRQQFGQGQGQDDQGGNNDEGQDDGNASPQTYRTEALGSGFIIDPHGYIVTNNHVIANATKISVKLPDGREFPAKLVGADSETDVALIRVEGVSDLPTVAFGDDRRLRVGDWVVAVGNPFGLGGSVTAGIVSFIGRDVGAGPYTDYIQIDAPINRGNSGGPTFDLSGRVIGMNTAIFSPSGGSVGIGFAIPASVVEDTVEQLKEHGSVTRGWLGVVIQNVTPDMASGLGITAAKGAIVASVIPNSPAAIAGVRQGDVVLSVNGSDVDDTRDLTRKVAVLKVGEKANLNVMRLGAKMTISVVIAKRNINQLADNEKPPTPVAPPAPPVTNVLGMKLTVLTPALRGQRGINSTVSGLIVTNVDPNSDAADKGLSPGDVVMSINMKPVTSASDILSAVGGAKVAKRDHVILLVAGQEGQRFVAVNIDDKKG